ncbi:MAG: aminoacetone oxidase family FAD-binding enzyme, partial [Clostridia bacterium]|nr:aminoacetone oxidase family FAD-binding enzyme [Clostridia bacterium]
LTHFGISGPMVLSLSSVIADSYENVEISIDLKPALDEQTLDARLLRDLEENRLKTVKGAFHALLPSKLLDAVMAEAGINGEGNVSDFTKADRRRLLSALKEMRLTVSGMRSFDEAIVTRGGVSVSEVNSSTMESKLVKGLYFAGEVLDVDAMTGGFNLQIAWSTGVLAGRSIGQ